MYTNDRIKWEIYSILKKQNPDRAKEYKTKALRLKYSPQNSGWVMAFSKDFDSFTIKKFFPYFFNDEEKQEFINDYWVSVNSSYDCTGQVFTMGIDFYKVQNGTWVYHHKALDV